MTSSLEEGVVAPDVSAPVALSPHRSLPSGTLLREIEIVGVIDESSQSIVYFAYDPVLQRRAAVKEYMPVAMASRLADSAEVAVEPQHERSFRLGLENFLGEARLLAGLGQAALVKVDDCWEENGTAYRLMPFYEGPTLRRALASLGRLPTEAELRCWLLALLDALDALHAAGNFHPAITPDNILFLPEGPLLLDAGTPGPAAGSAEQASWIDLQALAEVARFAITDEATGAPPLGRYSAQLLDAISMALASEPQEPARCAAEVRELLLGHPASPLAAGMAAGAPSAPALRDRSGWRMLAAASALALLAAGVAYVEMRGADGPVATVDEPRTASPAQTAASSALHVADVEASAAPLRTGLLTSSPARAEPQSPRASAPTASTTTSTSAECNDILQKASLQTLTPSELAFMKKECQ